MTENALPFSDHEQAKSASWELRGNLQITIKRPYRECMCCLPYESECMYWRWCEKRQVMYTLLCILQLISGLFFWYVFSSQLF